MGTFLGFYWRPFLKTPIQFSKVFPNSYPPNSYHPLSLYYYLQSPLFSYHPHAIIHQHFLLAAMSTTNTLSPELKALLKSWCTLQEEKYGPDWKKKLAKEMTQEPQTQELLKILSKKFPTKGAE